MDVKVQTGMDGLGPWLERAEAMGEMKRITAEVDPDLEMSTIAYMVGREIGSPALLFENIKGHPGQRALYNMMGSSYNRISLAIREEPGKQGIEFVELLKEKMKRRLPPTMVDAKDALVNQNIETGDDVDITKFPAPKMWPRDGGKYIGTADALITKDPLSGRINLGTYRNMIKSRNEEFTEGPFGEFTGYYARPEDSAPYIEISTVRYKDDPILTCALMADWPANECGLFWAMARAAKIWEDLDSLGVPGIRGVWSPPEAAGWGMTVVSIEQRFPGHAAQVMALAAQCVGGAYFSKYIIVVDHDVDPAQLSEVVWAMVTRSRPSQSIDILRETWSTYLDPSLNPPEIRPWGSKCLINACMEFKYIKEFSPRTKLSKPVYQRVGERWGQLGLKGEPPKVKVFEEDEPSLAEEDEESPRAPM